MMDEIQGAGVRLIQLLQQLSPLLDRPMQLISSLGDPDFYLFALPILYWLVSPGLAIRLLVILLVTLSVTDLAKYLLQQPRPHWLGSVKAIGAGGGYGLPSGHASCSLATWGRLAQLLGRPMVWAVALTMIGLIGLSRVYLGVHFPHDVLGGWLLALVVMGLVAGAERLAGPWLLRQPLPVWIGLCLVGSLLYLELAILPLPSLFPTASPSPWARFVERPVVPDFATAGALFGATVGFRLAGPTGPTSRLVGWRGRLLGLLLGLLGLLLLWRGLALLFALIAADGTVLGFGLRFLRYGLVTLWVAAGAPWLFARLRLAQPAGSRR